MLNRKMLSDFEFSLIRLHFGRSSIPSIPQNCVSYFPQCLKGCAEKIPPTTEGWPCIGQHGQHYSSFLHQLPGWAVCAMFSGRRNRSCFEQKSNCSPWGHFTFWGMKTWEQTSFLGRCWGNDDPTNRWWSPYGRGHEVKSEEVADVNLLASE